MFIWNSNFNWIACILSGNPTRSSNSDLKNFFQGDILKEGGQVQFCCIHLKSALLMHYSHCSPYIRSFSKDKYHKMAKKQYYCNSLSLYITNTSKDIKFSSVLKTHKFVSHFFLSWYIVRLPLKPYQKWHIHCDSL